MATPGESIHYFDSATPIWTRRIANELWSGPVSPLTYALLAESMAEHMVRRPLRVAGLADLAALPVLRRHASHVYVNAALLGEVIRLLPGGLRSAGLLDLLPPTAAARVGAGSSWTAGGLQALAIALRSWWSEPSWAPWQRATAFEREAATVRHELGVSENPGTFGAKPSAAALLADLGRVRARLGRYLDVVSWGIVFAYVFYHLLYELVGRCAPALASERAALTIGLPGIAALEAHHELRALGAALASDADVAGVLAREGAAGAAARLADDDGPAGRSFRAFLERHGHRLTGRDLSCPTWRESPALVVALAATSSTTKGSAATLAPAARRIDATARVAAALGSGPMGAARRAAFSVTLATAQRYYALRENMRYHADFFLARMRGLALALGHELAAAGRLAAADDVFWLELDELRQAVEGETALGRRARERRQTEAADAVAPPPETLDEVAPPPVAAAGDATVLHGEVGAPGRCRGRARLVRDPGDFERIVPGDVLIAVYTDPGWMPVLERAAGIVLEAGGLLSHGAIVARELGIPALVAVAHATRLLHDGDTVEVDADAGTVAVLSRT